MAPRAHGRGRLLPTARAECDLQGGRFARPSNEAWARPRHRPRRAIGLLRARAPTKPRDLDPRIVEVTTTVPRAALVGPDARALRARPRATLPDHPELLGAQP